MNAGICLGLFGSFEAMGKKMGGNLDRTTIALVLEKYSKSFDRVFVFSHDSKGFDSWLPENVVHIKLRNKYVYFLFGWLFVLYHSVKHDIRHIYLPDASALTPIFMINKLTGAKVLLQYDNTLFMAAVNPVKRALFKLIEKFMLNFVDYFVISSEEIRKLVGDRKGILPFMKGITLKGLNPKEARIDPFFKKIKGRSIIYIGRLSAEKDPITAIKAYKIAKKSLPDLNMIICGDGILREECERIADDNVHFLGYVENVPSMLRGADILVLSSTYDASPKVLMEAMYMGKPCIATRVGGVANFIDESCGIMVEPKNPRSLASKIIYLMNNPDKMKKLGINGHRKVLEKHDLGKNVDIQIEIIKKGIKSIPSG